MLSHLFYFLYFSLISGASSTLSHDFYQIMVGWSSMSLFGWRQLAEWSIEFSCLDGEQRAELAEFHRQQWEEFCRWIVESYGAYAVGLASHGVGAKSG